MAIVFDKPALVDPHGIGLFGTSFGQGMGNALNQQMDASTLQKIIGPILNNPNPQTGDLLKTILQISSAPINDDLKRTAMYGLHSATLKPQQESKIIEWWDEDGKAHREAVAPNKYTERIMQIEENGGTLEKPSYTLMHGYDPKTGKRVLSKKVRDGKEEEFGALLEERGLVSEPPEKEKTKEVLITNGKRTKLWQLKPGEEVPDGWKIKNENESRGEKLNLSDVKGAYGMEMNSIKTRMLIDMTPEERNQLANLPPEQMLAVILGGGGKSLPADKKANYIEEIKKVDEYYGGLSQKVLGRKGVTAPKGTGKQTSPAINEAVKYLKESKDRTDAVARLKALSEKGWTKADLKRVAKVAGWE